MKFQLFKFHLESWITLAVIILVESERPKFRDDYRYEKGFDAFYKLHHAAAPWREARVRCRGEAAALLAPASLDEADAMPLLISTILNNYEGVFIGIHDLYAEGMFVAIDGSSMVDSILNLLWEHKEPLQGAGRCLVMRHNGRLLVRPCDKPLPFICKVNAADIEHNRKCNTFDPRWKLGANATCYLMHTEPQSWFEAFGTCLAAGGHLAIMNSRSEADYVRSVFREVPEQRLPNNDFAFLGFSDLFQRLHFRTIKGQRIEDSGFADWTLTCGQAGNRSCMQRDRCGGLYRSGLLAMADCRVPAMFICEKTANAKNTHEQKPHDKDKKTTKPTKPTKKAAKTKGHLKMGADVDTDPITTTASNEPSTSSKKTTYTIENTNASTSDSVRSLTDKETKSLSMITEAIPPLNTTCTTLLNQTSQLPSYN